MEGAIIGVAAGLVLAFVVLYFSHKRSEQEDQVDQFWFVQQTDEERGLLLEVVLTEGEFAGFVLDIYNIQLEDQESNQPQLSYEFSVQMVHPYAPESGQAAQYGSDEVAEWELSPESELGTPGYRLVVVSQTIVEQLVKHAMEMHEKEQAQQNG